MTSKTTNVGRDVNWDGNFSYPGSDTLKNNYNIRDEGVLLIVEGPLADYAQSQLMEKNLKVKDFDISLLKTIHRKIFSDIYPWAGKVRDFDMAKEGTKFHDAVDLPNRIDYVFGELKKESYLKDRKGLGEMVKGLAVYHNSINEIHPFREGNGRSLKVFMTLLARYNDYDLNFKQITRNEQIHADIEAVVKGDLTQLALAYARIIEPLPRNRDYALVKLAPERTQNLNQDKSRTREQVVGSRSR